LLLNWSGYSPTDTLTLDVPQNSIDVNYMSSVPEPFAGTFVATIGAACLLGRWPRK
jgi:hypothetical protein